MQPFAKYNDDVKYLLTVIDVFSKYGWIVPLNDKSGKSTASGFVKILEIAEENLVNYGLIKEKNFIIKMLKKLVELYSTENEEKSCVD